MADSNGTNDGRGPGGRFAKGNSGGPGNPNLANLNRHRTALLESIKDDDIRLALDAIRKVLLDENARPADKLTAAENLLNRVLGKPADALTAERLDQLEAAISKLEAESCRQD